METADKKVNELKIIFSLISVFLMIPQLITSGSGYYKTLFIFLINRVIDMILKKQDVHCEFLKIWGFINQWVGVLTCAFSFSLLMDDFLAIFTSHAYILDVLDILMFVIVVSCVLREFAILIIKSAKEKQVRIRIRKSCKTNGGSLNE